jgi:plasmid stabilization system protein ParE
MPDKYFILFLEIAREELRDAKEYLDEINPELSGKFALQMDVAMARLSKNPFLFQKVLDEKRQVIIKPFQYKLIYEIYPEDKTVLILAVIHGAQSPKRWISR